MSSVSPLDSLYDTFAEESIDKPAKKSKLGRLSGQWKYGENIPRPEDGADAGLLVQPMVEAVELEAELEAALDGKTSDSPSHPIGDENEAHADKLANSAAGAHPTRSAETDSHETEERRTLVEDEPLPMRLNHSMINVTDSREGPITEKTRDLSPVGNLLQSSNPQMYGEEHSSVEKPDGSTPRLTSTAMQTADIETASPPLDEDGWEAPIPPSSPLLRPTASPDLPLVSPSFGRLLMDSSVRGERQDEILELTPDTEEAELESQSTPDPTSEVSDQDDEATRRSTEGDQDMDRSDSYYMSPSGSEQSQLLGERSRSLDGSRSSREKGRDPSDGISMPTELAQGSRVIPSVYASSPQKTGSEPPSSVGSASDNEIGHHDESSVEDFEDLASDKESSETPTHRTESISESGLLESAEPEEEQSWEAESDDEEINQLAQRQSFDGTDAKNKKVEPLSTQGPEVIDLGDSSENDEQPDATSPELQTPEETSSSPVSLTSPSEHGSRPSEFDLRSSSAEAENDDRLRPSEFDLNSSTADSINDDETSDHMTYPTLPEEDWEEPSLSNSPVPPQLHSIEAGLGAGRGTQLYTPDATQLTHMERSLSIELRYDNHDLPTPQPTQNTTAGLLLLDVVDRLEDNPPLSYESRRPTLSLARDLGSRRSTIPDVISPWCALKRSSQVYEASEEDSESGSESEQGLDPTPQDIPHPLVEPDIESTPYSQISELDTSTTIEKGYTITQNSRPAPPMVGLRTPLSYFSPLALIHDHFASTIDVLAIITSKTRMQRAKSGPKDYHLTFSITDPSSEPSYIKVQIFRPFSEALPVASNGAAILLRNFKVESQKHKFVLVSTATSAWAVFEDGRNVQVNGPPVEIGAEERGFAKGLSQWWASLGQDVQSANGERRGHGHEKRRDIDYPQ